jgi:hypothetical protein
MLKKSYPIIFLFFLLQSSPDFAQEAKSEAMSGPSRHVVPQTKANAPALWARIRLAIDTKYADLTAQNLAVILDDYLEPSPENSSSILMGNHSLTKFEVRKGLPFEIEFSERHDQIKLFGFNLTPAGGDVPPVYCIPVSTINQDLQSSGWRLTSQNRFEGAAASNLFENKSRSLRLFLNGGCAVSLVMILGPAE